MARYRQGDLLFIQVMLPPKGERMDSLSFAGRENYSPHVLSCGVVYNVEKEGGRESFYVDIPEGGAELSHSGNNTVTLIPGVYRVICHERL